MKRIYTLSLVTMSLLLARAADAPKPPIAKVIPKTVVKHGHERVDNYYWLNDRENPDVIDYLNAENDYRERVMAHVKDFEDALFTEIVGRIKPNDESVPYKKGDYYYYTRFEKENEYPIFCRKQGSLESDEQVMLDSNKLAEGHEFFSVRGNQISSGQNLLAFATDTVGRRFYTLRFRDLDTGKFLEDEIPNVTGMMAWAEDNQTLFYAKQHPETLRSYRIYRHRLGANPADDELVYEEPDDTFFCGVMKTKSDRYITIGSFHTLSTEWRFLRADDPEGAFEVLSPRERDHEHFMDHYEDHFYILSNDEAKTFA